MGHVEGTIDLGQGQGKGQGSHTTDKGNGQSQDQGKGSGKHKGQGQGSSVQSIVVRFLSDLRHSEYYRAIAQVQGLVDLTNDRNCLF